MPRLRLYMDEIDEALGERISFVEVQGPNAKIIAAPPAVRELLRMMLFKSSKLSRELPPIVSLQEEERGPGVMVALAACLLDFPVAYVPVPSVYDTAFLPGVPLDVYACVLVHDTTLVGLEESVKHVVLQFSCPQIIAGTTPNLRPEALVERLRDRLEERLEKAGFPGKLVVQHTVETRDRVAL